MRIYIFVEHYPNPYKPYFDTQFSYLIHAGHEVHIFAYDKYVHSVNREVLKNSLDKKTSYYPNTLKYLPRFFFKMLWSMVRNNFKLVRRLRQVYNNTLSLKNNFMAMSRVILLPLEEPSICLVHNLSTLINFTFLHSLYPHAKIVMYYHGGEVGRYPKGLNGEAAFTTVDKVFTNTEFSREHAKKRGCPENKVVICPVGFTLDKYEPAAAKQYRPHGFLRIISIGRLSQEKGFFYSLKAIKILADKGITSIRYTILGNGYLFKEMEGYIQQNNLTDTIFLRGEKTNDEVISELKESDVLILPSITTSTWAETQACVVQEALLMKLLVIATRTGGVPESISPNMRPFLVAEHDPLAICTTIEHILSLSQQECADLGNSGRSFAVSKFGIEHLTNTMLNNSFHSE